MSDPGARILCIEDNPMNWRLVQRLLSQAGFEMHWADHGLKGYEMALELKPTLILLDINLPGLSGFEVATKLRQNASLDGTLIVALTAKTMRSDRETALVTGCDGFISKPIDPFLFVGQVEAYLGGRRDQLEQGREEPALRQFNQTLVQHLETQLLEAQEGNRRLLAAQAELEQRSSHLSRLVALSKDIIPVRDETVILGKVLGQLQAELALEHLRVYRQHSSGAYLQGWGWDAGTLQQAPVIPESHPLVAWLAGLPPGGSLADAELRQSQGWELGLELGLWGPTTLGLLLPLQSRSGDDHLWGFLASDRGSGPFQGFELELAALHAGLLQVSLENAELITHLAETSKALGESYEGMESAYEALKEAQRALGAQNQKTALGGLFINMAKRLQAPVNTLKEESATLSVYMERRDVPPPEERTECHRAMAQIHASIAQVDGMVKALLRRAGRAEAASPEWIHLHELIVQEFDLMRAEGGVPLTLPIEFNLQAPRDLVYGVCRDFAEVVGHLVEHATGGQPAGLILRTWGGQQHFRLEVEDDGGPIEDEALLHAFEPFHLLRPDGDQGGRRPGNGLPACAQLMQAYGGSVEIQPAASGTLVRVSFPIE